MPEPLGAKTQPVAVPGSEKSPAVRPVTASLKVKSNTRVVAFVTLSAFELPLSDAACRSIRVTVGAIRSTVTAGPSLWAFVLPPPSVTALAASRSVTVPFVQPVSVTVYDAGPPAGAPTTQPVAVPRTAKSAAVRPMTVSPNATAKVRLAAFVMLSVFELPLSDAACRSGVAPGARLSSASVRVNNAPWPEAQASPL